MEHRQGRRVGKVISDLSVSLDGFIGGPNVGVASGAAERVFDALGDPTRRALVARLSRGPMSVSDLGRPFGITLAAVVQHVRVLERSELVRTEKVGRVRTCWIEPTGFDVAAAWLAERRALWEQRLDRLGDVLAEEARPREDGRS